MMGRFEGTLCYRTILLLADEVMLELPRPKTASIWRSVTCLTCSYHYLGHYRFLSSLERRKRLVSDETVKTASQPSMSHSESRWRVK